MGEGGCLPEFCLLGLACWRPLRVCHPVGGQELRDERASVGVVCGRGDEHKFLKN